VKLFFSSHKDLSWNEAEKIAYPSSLPHFSLLSMHEAIGEAVLPNIFFQNSSASPKKLLMKLFSKKIALLLKLSCAKRGLTTSVKHDQTG
jgi:hypothetical protein